MILGLYCIFFSFQWELVYNFFYQKPIGVRQERHLNDKKHLQTFVNKYEIFKTVLLINTTVQITILRLIRIVLILR